MGKVLAIDYGTKKVGIAVTDDLQLIASGLTTVATAELLPFVIDYVENNNVETIVVGEPKDLQNNPAVIEQHIVGFIRKLEKQLPAVKIARLDERFTSKMAFQTMVTAGLGKKKRKDKELVDKISATLILQNYLETKL